MVLTRAVCLRHPQILTAFCLIFLYGVSTSPITNPLRSDSGIADAIPDYFDRKTTKVYHNSTPHARKNVPTISYNSPDPDCNVGFKLAWSSSVGSPVFSSPVIFPSGAVTIFMNLMLKFLNSFFSLLKPVDCNLLQVLMVISKYF